MTKKSKIFAGILAAAMTMGVGFAAGCGGSDNPGGGGGGGGDKPLAGTYDAKIWVAEAAVELTQQQIAKYNQTNTDGITINANVVAEGEGEAATDMIADVETGADLYCFAQDQFARLKQAEALSKLGAGAAQTVRDTNDQYAVSAASIGNDVYAYPLTADNGYFMYYDKSVVSESSVTSLERIIADCEAAGKQFSFFLEGSAWYAASFFFATGCNSEWVVGEDGKFTNVNDTFNSPEGLIAAKGMYKLLNSTCYNNSEKAASFEAAIKSAVVISGTWDYTTAYGILGDNLGVAELPSFEVDGKSYHLGSYRGYKLLGVKPQTDAKKSSVMHKLAQYLTSEAAQIERFETLSWGPANTNAQNSDAVKANPGLAALSAQAPYGKLQGQIHGSWWDIGKAIATDIKNSGGTDEGLQSALTTYKNAIDGIFSMSEEEKNAYTVIGSINGDGWTVDLPMTEISTGVWKTTVAYDLKENDEFKVRQGKSWDVSYGDGNSNFKVTTAGTYYIQFTISGDVGTIELIAA